MKIVQWKKQITPPLGQLNDSNIIKQSQSEQGPSFSCWSWLVLTGKLCGRDLGNSSSITLCSPGSPVSTSISPSFQLELCYDPVILEIFLMYSKGQTPRAFMNFSTVEKCLKALFVGKQFGTCQEIFVLQFCFMCSRKQDGQKPAET